MDTSGTAIAPPARRWWIPVLAALVVVAAIVGTFAVLEMGPFASEPSLPSVGGFPAERYGEDDHGPVLISDIATLTVRPPEGGRTFTPEQMVDADPETAWHAASEQLPPDTDQHIDLFLAEPTWVDQLVLANGDQSDSDAYAASARVQRATVTFDGGTSFAVTFLDQGRELQIVAFPEPQLTTSVRLQLQETIPGAVRDDPAVSDLELRGWTALDDDAALAERRAEVRPAAGTIRYNGVSER